MRRRAVQELVGPFEHVSTRDDTRRLWELKPHVRYLMYVWQEDLPRN